MMTLARPGQRRRCDRLSPLLKSRCDMAPQLTTAPSAVNEHESMLSVPRSALKAGSIGTPLHLVGDVTCRAFADSFEDWAFLDTVRRSICSRMVDLPVHVLPHEFLARAG